MPILKDSALALGQGIIDVGDTAVGLADLVSRGKVRQGLFSLGYDPEQSKKFLQSFQTKKYQTEQDKFNKAGILKQIGMLVTKPKFAIKQGARILPMTLANIASGKVVNKALNPTLSYALGEGITTLGQESANRRSKEKPKLTSEELGQVISQAGLNVAGGYLGGKVGKRLGLNYLDEALGQSTMFTSPVKGWTNVGAGIINEGLLQQIPQQTLQDYFR